MPENDLEILDEGSGAHALSILSSRSEMYLGTSLILVHRLGFSERLLYKHLITGVNDRACLVLLTRPPKILIASQSYMVTSTKNL